MEVLPVAVPLSNAGPAGKKVSNNDNINNPSFKDIIDQTLQNLNENQLKSEETVKSFLTGEVKDIHTVMIALEEAKLSMQLAVEVRNKLVEAYQEISRMQV